MTDDEIFCANCKKWVHIRMPSDALHIDLCEGKMEVHQDICPECVKHLAKEYLEIQLRLQHV